MSFCVVPRSSADGDALLLGVRDVEREQPRRGGVDRHRRVHLAGRDAVEQGAHVAEVGDRDADLADLAFEPSRSRGRSRSGSAGRTRSTGRSAPSRGWSGTARSTPPPSSARSRSASSTAGHVAGCSLVGCSLTVEISRRDAQGRVARRPIAHCPTESPVHESRGGNLQPASGTNGSARSRCRWVAAHRHRVVFSAVRRSVVDQRTSSPPREPLEVLGPRDVDRTERHQVRGRPLHVEQRRAASSQPVDEVDQRDLRRVGRAVEHRLAGEQAADPDAVQPADQLARTPGA